jgi:Ca-activated chloride channel family protein
MSRRWVAGVVALVLIAAGCSSGGNDDVRVAPGFDDPGDCTVVDLAVSSEKVALMTELARVFNASSEAQTDNGCIFARPQGKASGAATTLLGTDWDEAAEGPRPVIWSPASSAWGAVLNQRLADEGKPAMAPEGRPFMQTPLVIAMPKPMADALGYPETPVGWEDVLRLARSEDGWAAYGHPEWGPFRLGKTNPNFSTSGLSALIAQAYAATGKTSNLSREDLDNPTTEAFATGVESAVVHYGDITGTFLNNWYRTDREGTSLTYASAVAVEEKSVIDYNTGNPDGVLDAGERPRKPRIPLVAVYPKEGTLYSDNPLFVLDAPWVSGAERKAAARFEAFVQRPANQRKVLEFGFRPGNPDVAVASPVVASNGVDPNQPKTLLDIPTPPVMIHLLEKWAEQRKSARVLIVLDVSGSMSEVADPSTGETRLDLAKSAAIEALDQFKDEDEVGLRTFTTSEDGTKVVIRDVLPIQPIGPNKEGLRREIGNQIPLFGTPLYQVTRTSFQEVLDGYDPTRINAVVLLTDGQQDDGDQSDDDAQERAMLEVLRSTQGETGKPVRIFPIAFAQDADKGVLKTIAEATNSASYNATDPKTITKVFTAVVSNF